MEVRLSPEQREKLRIVFTGLYASGGRGEFDPVLHVPRYNCWGLVMAVTDIFGRKVPDVKLPKVLTARAIDATKTHFEHFFTRVDTPCRGALIGLRTHPRLVRAVNHYGVMLDMYHFVHIQKNTGVHVSRLDVQPYNTMLAGIWTY